MTNQVKSKQLGDLIQEIIHHEVDVNTESDWFIEQLDERIERYFEDLTLLKKFKREEA